SESCKLQLRSTRPAVRGPLMRHVALQGFTHEDHRLSTTECWEVCEYVIDQSLAVRGPLDMRALVTSPPVDRIIAFKDNVGGVHEGEGAERQGQGRERPRQEDARGEADGCLTLATELENRVIG